MNASATPKGRELAWSSPQAGQRAFVLRAGEKEVGRLQFEDGVGGRSTAELDGRRWTFERTGAFYPSVTIYAEGASEPVAEFIPRLAGCGGVVSFASGVRYCWNRAHVWSASWCFRREGERSSVCVTQEAGPLKSGGKAIVCCDAAPLAETPVLVLLAWYLRVLMFARMAESIVVCG